MIHIKPLNDFLDESEDTPEFLDIRFEKLPFIRPPLDEFDPRDYRTPKFEIKPWMAYLNLLRTSISAGMLAVPMAVSQVGLIPGPLMIIGVGLLIIHTHMTLAICMIPPFTYGVVSLKTLAVMYYAEGKITTCSIVIISTLFVVLGFLIAVSMILNQLGMCTVFVLLSSDNLRDLMDWDSIVPALATLFIPFLIMQIFMKSLKIVSYVSTAGGILTTLAIILVVYGTLRDPRGDIEYVSLSLLDVLQALGTLLFNMSAVGVVLTCDKSLKDPKIMTAKYGVISVGILIPTLLACIFGVMGYYAFGAMEENILRSLPYDDPLTLVTFALYLLAMALAFPLQSHPAIDMLLEVFKTHDPLVLPSEAVVKTTEYISRPIFVTMSFLIANYLPFQAALVAFVGNLSTTLLALVFPALMEIGLLYPDHYGSYKLLLIKDIAIAVMGTISLLFGVGLHIYHLYILLQLMQSPNSTEFL